MKFKLDENLGQRGQKILQTAGHDVSTVAQQDLSTLVQTLADALKREQLTGKLWIVEMGRIRIYEEDAGK